MKHYIFLTNINHARKAPVARPAGAAAWHPRLGHGRFGHARFGRARGRRSLCGRATCGILGAACGSTAPRSRSPCRSPPARPAGAPTSRCAAISPGSSGGLLVNNPPSGGQKCSLIDNSVEFVNVLKDDRVSHESRPNHYFRACGRPVQGCDSYLMFGHLMFRGDAWAGIVA